MRMLLISNKKVCPSASRSLSCTTRALRMPIFCATVSKTLPFYTMISSWSLHRLHHHPHLIGYLYLHGIHGLFTITNRVPKVKVTLGTPKVYFRLSILDIQGPWFSNNLTRLVFKYDYCLAGRRRNSERHSDSNIQWFGNVGLDSEVCDTSVICVQWNGPPRSSCHKNRAPVPAITVRAWGSAVT